MLLRKFLLLFLCVWLLELSKCHDPLKEKYPLRRILKFDPDFQMEETDSIIQKNTLEFQFDVKDSLPKEVKEFTFCFMFNMKFLTSQYLFSSKNLSLKIEDAINGYGFVYFDKKTSYRFHIGKNVLRPMSWTNFCLVKSTLENMGTKIKFFYDGMFLNTVMDMKKEFIHNKDFLSKLVIGGSLQEHRQLHIQNYVYNGNMANIWATSDTLGLKELIPYFQSCEYYDKSNLFHLEEAVLGKENNYSRISKQNVEEICSLSRNIKISGNRRMSQHDALVQCRTMGGSLCLPTSNFDNFMWTSLYKDSINIQGFNGRQKWKANEPNGNEYQKCIAARHNESELYDEDCATKLAWTCCLKDYKHFNLRGFCVGTRIVDYRYSLLELNGQISFHGFKNSLILFYGNEWRLVSTIDGKMTTIAVYKGTNFTPIGTHFWYITGECNGEYVKNKKITLKLTNCNFEESSCKNGECLPYFKHCNNIADCEDKSDEENCHHLRLNNYKMTFPPTNSSSKNERLPIKISLKIFSIPNIKALDRLWKIDFNLLLQWRDNRIQTINVWSGAKFVLTNDEKNKLWIPQLIFDNSHDEISSNIINNETDITIIMNDFAKVRPMSQHDLYEGFVYDGHQSHIRYLHRHEIYFHCNFLLQAYPFDTQICSIKMSLVNSLINKCKLVLLDQEPIENRILLQFYIHSQFSRIEGNGSIFVMHVVFKRLFTNIFCTIYVPTVCLQIIALLLLFISEKRSDTILLLTSTTSLVMYSLYQNVVNSIPTSPYNMMIDYWLIFCLIIPFLVFVVAVTDSLLDQAIQRHKGLKKRCRRQEVRVKIRRTGKSCIIVITFVYDIIYLFFAWKSYSNEEFQDFY